MHHCRAFLGLVIACGCQVTIEREQGTLPLSFKVETREETGTDESPLPYTTGIRQFTLDVQAIDFQGESADWFDGEVFLDLAPRGRLANGQARSFMLTKGRAEGVTVQVQKIHGTSNIWVEDRGTEQKPGSYATGLSPAIHVQHPTLYDVSQTENIESSSLNGDFVQINTTGRRLVATGIAIDGFYIVDIDEPTDSFNAIFARTFSRPRGVEVGDIVSALIGTVEDFYGFTQLSFPSYKIDGKVDSVSVYQLDLDTVDDDLAMEKLESRLVEVRDVTVCPLGESYSRFGQWVVLLDENGNCSSGAGGITVVSALSAAMFTPEDWVGKVLTRITGNLRYHAAATPSWILTTRSDADIDGGG